MVFAVETLASLGVSLDGDLLVATNTDEESSGAGGTALVEHGLRADAGIVTEPTGFQVWVACRGSEYGVIRVPGQARARRGSPARLARGRRGQRDREGRRRAARRSPRCGAEWAARRGLEHPFLSPPVAAADAGARRRVAGDLPGVVRADDRGDVPAGAGRRSAAGAATVRREVEEWIARETRRRTTGWPRASAGDRVVAERRDAVRDLRLASRSSSGAAGRHRRRRPPGRLRRTRLLVRRGDADAARRASRRSATGRPGSTPTGSASRT